jgi:hypothetical protein
MAAVPLVFPAPGWTVRGARAKLCPQIVNEVSPAPGLRACQNGPHERQLLAEARRSFEAAGERVLASRRRAARPPVNQAVNGAPCACGMIGSASAESEIRG